MRARGDAYASDELDVVALDVADDHDLQLAQEVETQLVHRVAQNGLLHQQHVAAGLLDLLAHLQNVLALLAQQTVHLRVVVDDHLVVDVRLRSRQVELRDANLRVHYAIHAKNARVARLREHQTLHQLAVVDCPTKLLHDVDVAEVHLVLRHVAHAQHRVHRDGRQNL